MRKLFLLAAKIGRAQALPVLLALSLLLAACGGGQPEPTATPVAAAEAEPTATVVAVEPTSTPAPEAAVAQVDSPLAQPESPLAQPESPLVLPPFEIGRPIDDFALITRVAAEQTPPAPKPGRASISGVLYSYSTSAVIPGTAFYLTPAIESEGTYTPPTLYSGPKEANGDVGSFSDDYGRFAIDDVPPGVYYLAVFAPYDWILAFESQDARMPLQIQLEEGEQLDLELLWLSWPNGG
jgi:hypothetical protein